MEILKGKIEDEIVEGNKVMEKNEEEKKMIEDEGVRIMNEGGIKEDEIKIMKGDGRIGEEMVEEKEN